MGLFKSKKDSIKDRIKPPTFPDLSELQFPSYEPSFPSSTESIKKAIKQPIFPEPESRPSRVREERAIFVQLDRYKEALDILEMVKEKLRTSQSILNELNELKKQEDSEFAEWQANIEEIKEKLYLIDNNLFEV